MPTPASQQPKAPAPPPPQVPYQANAFTMKLAPEWRDQTVFTLTGPVENGVQHNVVIMVDTECAFENVADFADWHIRTIEEEVKGCRLLKKDKVQLSSGLPAVRAIFRWYPAENIRFYQEHLFVVAHGMGFKLAATFSRKTRKTLGPSVERMMLTFNPQPPKPKTAK